MDTHYDLVVVGGGPAGSTAATMAAKKGLRVLLLEADQHPRVHVGESLLPGIVPILDEMGVLGDIEGAGFTRKTGSTHWGWGMTPEWDLWFTDSESYDHAWLVDRSRFDELLFLGATRAGVDTRTHTAVKSFVFEGDRIVGVTFQERGSSEVHRAFAPLTVDASGQASLLSRHLGLRAPIPGLQHEASWAHFEGAQRLAEPRAAQALFTARGDHWTWFFPLSPTRSSIGIVRLQDNRETSSRQRDELYDRAIADNELLTSVIGPDYRRVTPVRHLHDWSYRTSRACGPGWLLAGDAAMFIDPVLSTGVQLAMNAGYAAAGVARALIDGAPEADLQRDYQTRYDALFDDLLRIVRFFYQQNLHRDEYFWESKRILMSEKTALRPQKAFMVLTSGLIRNLPFQHKREATLARREGFAATDQAQELDKELPDQLGFVCLQMRYRGAGENAVLYFLIEPIDPAAPTLFTTRNWHVNCLAPRYNNDPVSEPAIGPHLRDLGAKIKASDTVPNDTLRNFWGRHGGALVETIHNLPGEFQLERVFGE